MKDFNKSCCFHWQSHLTSTDVSVRNGRCERSYRSVWACVSVEVRRLWLWLISLYTFVVVLLNYFTPYLFLYWITLHAWKVLLKRFTQMFFLQSYSPMLTSANYPLGNNLFHPVLTLLLYSCPASVSESSFHCSCADVCYCKNQRCP